MSLFTLSSIIPKTNTSATNHTAIIINITSVFTNQPTLYHFKILYHYRTLGKYLSNPSFHKVNSIFKYFATRKKINGCKDCNANCNLFCDSLTRCNNFCNAHYIKYNRLTQSINVAKGHKICLMI